MSEQTPGPDPHTPQGEDGGAPRQDATGYFIAGAGVTAVEELTLRRRALDRTRLDEYACLVAAAMNVSTSVELAYRSPRAELAAALHLSEYAIERELDIAHTLATRYAGAREALGAGLIDLDHVKVICDAGAVIGSSDDALLNHALYEEAVLTYAVDESPGRLRPIARRLAEQFAAISLEERHEAARCKRRVVVYPGEDGMAEVSAILPAELAYAIRDRIQRIAKEVWRAEPTDTGDGLPPEPRTLDAVRADTFAEVLLTGTPYTSRELGAAGTSRFATPGFFAHLQITVPVEALTDTAEASDSVPDPESRATPITGSRTGPRPVSELAGYGPISTRIAAELLETTRDIYRVDHDRTGQVLRIERYAPTKQMRRLLAARDQHCRFPGCTRVPLSCDIDHTIAWQDGGPTSTDNLECLCKGHHLLKHHSAWTPVLDETGMVLWTSPSGKIHEDRPSRRTYRRPRPPRRPDHSDRLGQGSSPPQLRRASKVGFTEAPRGPDDEPF